MLYPIPVSYMRSKSQWKKHKLRNNKTPQSYILYASGDMKFNYAQTLIWFIWDFTEMRVYALLKHSLSTAWQITSNPNRSQIFPLSRMWTI